MNRWLPLVYLLSALLVGACSTTTPLSFEEALSTHIARRNDVPDWESEMRYRVGFQYANAARVKLANPRLETPADTNLDFEVPFIIYDYAQGDRLGATISFFDWFNSGLSSNSRYGHYYNRGLAFMGSPNTHYFTFDDRPGEATVDDVHAAWDEAYALFSAVHNANGDCYVIGFNEQDQYARTYPKDVLGLYKEVGYYCRHPVLRDREYRVFVSAFANPFDDVRVLAAVQPQCFVTGRGEKFVDVRDCGIKLADHQRDRIPASRFGWMELIVTPVPATPSHLQVVARQGSESLVLPAPEQTQKYLDFLSARPYSEN